MHALNSDGAVSADVVCDGVDFSDQRTVVKRDVVDYIHIIRETVTIIMLLSVLFMSVVYFCGFFRYIVCFYPNSYIGGVDVSGVDMFTADSYVRSRLSDYQCRVVVNGSEKTIYGSEIGLSVDLRFAVFDMVISQNAFRWMEEAPLEHNYSARCASVLFDSRSVRLRVTGLLYSMDVSDYNVIESVVAEVLAAIRDLSPEVIINI